MDPRSLSLPLRAWQRVGLIWAVDVKHRCECGGPDVLLADDFFRLSHDDTSGRPLLYPVGLSAGLAAALVAELVVSGHVAVHAGHLLVVSRDCEPLDVLSARVLDMLRREHHSLRVWLEFLGRGAVIEVAGRLESASYVRTRKTRRLGRMSVTYVPVNVLEASRPRAVLATRLMHCFDLDAAYVPLAGLMMATGLDAVVLPGATPQARDYVDGLVSGLPAGLRELCGHVEALVGSAVLAHRT
jgi:hypothetical protein